MPIAEIELEDGRIVELDVPEGTTEAQVMSFIQKNQQALRPPKAQPFDSDIVPAQDDPSDIPRVDEAGVPIYDDYDNRKYRSIVDKAVGVGETALTIGSGATGGIVGTILGTGKGLADIILSGEYGTKEGADKAQKMAERYAAALTYAPRTEAGQDYAENTGEFLQAAVGGLPPVAIGAQGAIASGLRAPLIGSKMAAKNVSKAVSGTGNKIIDTAKSLKAGEGFSPMDSVIKSKIAAGDADVSFLGKSIKDGKVIESPLIKAAQKQGFKDTAIRSAETANQKTSSAMREMIKTLKTRLVNADFAAKNRTTDTIGNAVSKRYQALVSKRKEAGAAVEKASKSLQGKDFDLTPMAGELFQDLKDSGIKIRRTPEGKLKADYSGVDAVSVSGTKTVIDQVVKRINESGGKAVSAHKIKRLIDDAVDYGKLPTADTRIVKGVDNALKKFRHNVGEGLNAQFEKYGKANKRYSEISTPLQSMDSVFKSILRDSSGAALDAGLGTKAARTLMSNNTGRAAMLETLGGVDKALRKVGVGFNDDIVKLSVFADEIERVFGSESSTSLGGASQRASESAILSALGADPAISMTVSGIKKIVGNKVSQKEAIAAIEAIINNAAKSRSQKK